MDFTFLEVNDSELLEKVFAFRYNIVSEIYPEYFKISCATGTTEQDEYDPYSTHFAVLDKDDEVCATVRLIYNSPIGYPTENSMVFDRDMFDKNKLGEMSRIFVDAKYRNIKTTKMIVKHLNELLYVKMMRLGIEYTYGSLEGRFLRLLKICKMNYNILGEEQMHKYVGLRYPSILYTEQFGNDNPELVELWERENES